MEVSTPQELVDALVTQGSSPSAAKAMTTIALARGVANRARFFDRISPRGKEGA